MNFLDKIVINVMAAAGSTTPDTGDGAAPVLTVIDRIKAWGGEIAVGCIGLALIGVAITAMSGKDGTEKAKPWGKGLIVAAVILLAGDGIVAGLMGS